jgi:hypothetical protein
MSSGRRALRSGGNTSDLLGSGNPPTNRDVSEDDDDEYMPDITETEDDDASMMGEEDEDEDEDEDEEDEGDDEFYDLEDEEELGDDAQNMISALLRERIQEVGE